MRVIGISLVILLLMSACTTQQITQTINDYLEDADELTTTEVTAGLKAALEKGVTTGTAQLSATDGYLANPKVKIPFPEDVQKVEQKLRDIGLGGEVDKFVTSLNRGAEAAAKEAQPIFVSAIASMTIDDAWAILQGDDQEAATNYLRRTTSDQLEAKFSPVIKAALDETSATKYYSDIVNTYNKIPFVEKVNPNLEAYATEKAMEGLFLMIAEEEKEIRKNPAERTSEILKRVFAQQD